jgi:hypothetical protein
VGKKEGENVGFSEKYLKLKGNTVAYWVTQGVNERNKLNHPLREFE